jgi:hypothetical protein
MKILLSWSGSQSKAVAAALRQWLPTVIPGVDPWMSQEDISKGRSWFISLLDALSDVRACVICVTPQNVHAPWIHFEAGAIACKKDDAHVFSYLVGVPSNLVSATPLGQYQWTLCDKDDTWRLVKSVNKALGGEAHDEGLLETQFKQKWRQLKQRVEAVLQEQEEEEKRKQERQPEGPPQAPREMIFHPTAEEVAILLKTSESPTGTLNFVQGGGRCQILIGAEHLVQQEDSRTMMRWREAVERLLSVGLLKDVDQNGEIYHLSSRGYSAADQIRRQRQVEEEDDPFPDLERMMPQLLAEMRQDLTGNPLMREFVLLKRSWVFNAGSPVLTYYFDDHPEIENQVHILENHGLVTDVTSGRTKRYRLSEDLVEYLLAGKANPPAAQTG